MTENVELYDNECRILCIKLTIMDAPTLWYFHTNLKLNPSPYHQPTQPKIKPEKYENGLLHQNRKK